MYLGVWARNDPHARVSTCSASTSTPTTPLHVPPNCQTRVCACAHQQYLAKNPDGYCPDHSCGVPYKSESSVTQNNHCGGFGAGESCRDRAADQATSGSERDC